MTNGLAPVYNPMSKFQAKRAVIYEEFISFDKYNGHKLIPKRQK